MTESAKALISFSVGPVQDFIAAARTTRDLYNGSRLLGLLAGAAAKVVLKNNGTFIFPSITRGPLPASLPNTFVAEVPEAEAQHTATACRDAAIAEWRRLSRDVHNQITNTFPLTPGWDVDWEDQIDHFWDIRVLSIPVSAGQDPEVRRLLGANAGAQDQFSNAMLYLKKMSAAHKQIRHYPAHEADGRDNTPIETRPKCSLLGTFAQMGPRQTAKQMGALADFWNSLRGHSIQGIRVGRADRLCAVSLVKRFAAIETDGSSRMQPNRFPDVDTICASQWLAEAGLTDESRQRGWSGHWLRWEKLLNEDEAAVLDEDQCPPEIWEKIRAARKTRQAPPAYFAVLMIDGDAIGSRLDKSQREDVTKISAELNRFATQIVPPIVTQHHGTLVYAGGDDVLAFLPAIQAIPCAWAISGAFGTLQMPPGDTRDPPTVSAGVAIVHYKENLRLALAAAREAEAAAKTAGGKRLALAVQRRSGGRETLPLKWKEAHALNDISADFNGGPDGASDRWAYHFRHFIETIGGAADWGDGRRMELGRLLARSQGTTASFRKKVLDFWDTLHAPQENDRPASRADTSIPSPDRLFIDGILAASFLARIPKE